LWSQDGILYLKLYTRWTVPYNKQLGWHGNCKVDTNGAHNSCGSLYINHRGVYTYNGLGGGKDANITSNKAFQLLLYKVIKKIYMVTFLTVGVADMAEEAINTFAVLEAKEA
jgi:hypothetical protein